MLGAVPLTQEKNVETVFSVLGFTTLEGVIWNSVAYAAVLAIIAALFLEKYDTLRYTIFAISGVVLVAYSHFSLHDVLFTILQTVITISALFQLLKFKPWSARVSLGLLTFIAIILLVFNGNLNSTLSAVGAVGFIGIAAGVVLLPLRAAFIVMAVGGAFLIGYAWETAAWVFFILNIVFVIANLIQWGRSMVQCRGACS